MEIIGKPDFYEACKKCKALSEVEGELKTYSGVEKQPTARISCFGFVPPLAGVFLKIQQRTLGKIRWVVSEKEHENDPNVHHPTWEAIVACPGAIDSNSLVSR